ncbi:MAG TPA: alkaline phosphatase D family protein [Kofleriaceae bacterium]|nr:alkaline phosphatase D family protein [Kofleriaceae bacterium]
MKRRDFLRGAGWFVAGAALSGIPGCGSDAKSSPDANTMPQPGTWAFPQGVASGDPRTTSVVLWTRAVLASGAADDVAMKVQVASDSAFATVVVDMAITATAASDHTVRVLVTGLAANTAYFYRFVAGADSKGGQTHTAPDATADTQVNIAWVSCQDYPAGNYGAYRQMLLDDGARAAGDQVHFVVHLGDVIYETVGADFSKPLDDNFGFVTIKNADGKDRVIPPLPSGGGMKAGNVFAKTLDDYRAIYKTIMADPDFQAARARWPFIHTWDDHEFTNDCWQSQANYDNNNSTDEPSQTRRLAGSRAWFEYVPSQLTGAGGDAHDFMDATVTDAAFTTPDADNFVDETNNAKAIGAITIYRNLRWGKHVELVMTDLRSYRSDHAIPEETIAGNPAFFDPRNVLIKQMVDTFDEGMTANNNNPPANVLGFDNPRTTSPVGTMMGKAQKQWWKDTMKASDATWKIWGNEVPLMQFFIKNDAVGPAGQKGNLLFADRIMDGDAWDGYPTERRELMTYLKDQNIKNVVVLTGDIHAQFAGVVMDDFDAGTPVPVAAELIAAGISSNSVFSFFESATRTTPATLRGLITVDATGSSDPGTSAYTVNMNLLLLHGTAAADEFHNTKSLTAAEAVYNPAINPWLKYADSNAQGYGYVKITATEVTGVLTTVKRPIGTPSDSGPGILRTATFTVPKDNPGGMTGPVMTGTKPFPMR